MPPRSLNVSEARRDLPRLVREVAGGGAAVAIGPRGRPAAVLIRAEEYDDLRSRAAAAVPPRGWRRLRLDLVGTSADLEADLRAIRGAVDPSAPARPTRPRPHRR